MDEHDTTDDALPEPRPETLEEFRASFSYGARSNLNFKFVKGLSDAEFGDFLEELLDAVARATDRGDTNMHANEIVDVAYRWQIESYSTKVDPESFRYRYDDVPLTPLSKPLSDSRLLLFTSSGHFVDGDDPMPFGETNLTQEQAEARINDSLKEPPTLSRIPVDTPLDNLRVRHGGYPVQAARLDPQVVMPLQHLRDLVADGAVGELVEYAYSFVGAAPQGLMRGRVGNEWAEMARDLEADAALLVPI